MSLFAYGLLDALLSAREIFAASDLLFAAGLEFFVRCGRCGALLLGCTRSFLAVGASIIDLAFDKGQTQEHVCDLSLFELRLLSLVLLSLCLLEASLAALLQNIYKTSGGITL